MENQPSSHNTSQVAKSFENAHNVSVSHSNIINATGNVTITNNYIEASGDSSKFLVVDYPWLELNVSPYLRRPYRFLWRLCLESLKREETDERVEINPYGLYFPVIFDKHVYRIASDRFITLKALEILCHIEDIAVGKSHQGKKLGLWAIQALTGINEDSGCYKTILNIPLYEKCGFQKKENEMAKNPPKRPESLK